MLKVIFEDNGKMSYVKNDFTRLIGKNNYVVSDLEY